MKWGFNFWYSCENTTGYLYQLELYSGKKDKVELNQCNSHTRVLLMQNLHKDLTSCH